VTGRVTTWVLALLVWAGPAPLFADVVRVLIPVQEILENPWLNWDATGSGNFKVRIFWPDGYYVDASGPWVTDGTFWESAYVFHVGNPRQDSSFQWFLTGQGYCDTLSGTTPGRLQEDGSGGWFLALTWPKNRPMRLWDVDVINNLPNGVFGVLEAYAQAPDGREVYRLSEAVYSGMTVSSKSFLAGCGEPPFFVRFNVWAKSLDTNAPDTMLEASWSRLYPDAPFHFTVTLTAPLLPTRDQEGFNIGDKVALRSIPTLLNRGNQLALDQLGTLKEILAKVGPLSGGPGGSTNVSTLFETRVAEWEDAATNNLGQAIADVASWKGAYQSQWPAIVSQLPDAAQVPKQQLGAYSLPSDTPNQNDWRVVIAGITLNLNPRLVFSQYFDLYEVFLWFFWFVVPLLWWYWAFSEARQAVVDVIETAPDGVTVSSGLFAAIARKASLALVFLLVGLTVGAIYYLFAYVLDWSLSVMPWSSWSAKGQIPSTVAKVWRMANEIFPLRACLVIGVTTLLVSVSVHGVVLSVLALFKALTGFARYVAPVLFLMLVGQVYADYTLRVSAPGDRYLVVFGNTERGYQYLPLYSGEYVLPSPTSSNYYTQPQGGNASFFAPAPGDVWVITVWQSGTNWVDTRQLLKTRQDFLTTYGKWIELTGAVFCGGFLLWILRRAMRPIVFEP